MKIRTDFVTNSSSSSFVIRRKYLTDNQVSAIEKHGELGKKLGIPYSDEEWSIDVDDDFVKGWTSMDNFSMNDFFDMIGINSRLIHWDTDDMDADDESDIDWESLLREIE